MELDFYNENRDDILIAITIALENEELILRGFESGKTVDSIWGESDYEYFLSLDQSNTKKLFEKLGVADKTDKQKLEAVRDKFSKGKGTRLLKEYCKKNNIETSFFSY